MSGVSRQRGVRFPVVARAVFWGALALGLAGCNVVIGAGAVVVLGGVGYLAGQCYDQVTVRVRDEAGQQTCAARVTVGREGSVHTLRPCYHASLTAGSWHFAAQQSGYEAAEAELSVPERKGACPHYTHTLELTLRRSGAPKEAPFARPKASPSPPVPERGPRPELPLGPAFPRQPTTAPPAPAPSAPSGGGVPLPSGADAVP